MNDKSRILIVDDEESIRKSLSRILEELGYACFTAADGREGLDAIGGNEFDVALIDIRMPNLNGLELLSAIRTIAIKTIPIVLSGHGSVSDATEAMKLGAFDYLEKPVSPEILQLAIEKACNYRKTTLYAQDMADLAEQWESTFNSIRDPVSIHDGSFKIVRANRAFANLFSIEPSKIAGMTCYELVHKTKQPCPACPHKQSLETGQAATAEFYEPSLELYLEVSTSPITNENGKAIGSVHIAKDVTQRKKADEVMRSAYSKLEKANQELKEMQLQMVQHEKLASIGQLAAGVAHEMNTPVGFVASNFQTLESYMQKIQALLDMYACLLEKIESSGNDSLKNEARDIRIFQETTKLDFILDDIDVLFKDSEEGLSRVASIIQNLRDFSRVDHPDNTGLYNLNDGIKATLVVARNELKYSTQVNPELSDIPPVFCNAGQINQVFLNVLVNAAQAMSSQKREEKGTITIRTYATDDNVICEICDDGPGIPPDILPKIFDPFFTTKATGKGTGLGLSVSYDIIVNKHRGDFLVESAVGKGTKFTIKLPLCRNENMTKQKDEEKWKTEQSCL